MSNVTTEAKMVWGSADVLRSTEISWKAKGLLLYILNKRPDVPLTMRQIVIDSREAHGSVRGGIAELVGAGYIRSSGVRGCKFELTNKAR